MQLFFITGIVFEGWNKNFTCEPHVALDGSSVSGSISGCRITGCVIMSHFPKGNVWRLNGFSHLYSQVL